MKLYKRENILKKIRGFYQCNDLIKIITGIRRCGKSSIMQLISDELIKNYKINKANVIFIDLNKRPYKRVNKPDELEKLIDSKTKDLKGTKYLFIDEIQNVKGFESVIEAYRLEEDFNFFITGSNSYLLSGELVTKLTGRYIEFEITTLTFNEYLQMKRFYKMPLKSNQEEFEKFIIEGGFPGSIFITDLVDKQLYSRQIIDEIFKKDIKRNHKIRNKNLFFQIQTYIINNFGSSTSINSIVAYLSKINKTKISAQTVYNYIELLENSRIISKCSRFDLKSKKSLNGDEKYYLSDLSIYFATNVDNRINYGQCLENITYNYLKSIGYEISIGKIGKFECDFILRNNITRDYSYVQISYSILGSQETEDREYRPLEAIKDNYPKYVLTCDTLRQYRNGIIHKNIIEVMSNEDCLNKD